MAQSQVYSLLQDSRGYLWMGTRGGGVSRFDGMNFRTYSVNEGLVNNYVFCIREAPDHQLWIGTNNGLSVYNGIAFNNFQPGYDSSQVWIVAIDFDKQGRKWLATNAGVVYMDAKDHFVNVSDALHQPRSVINTIHVDQDGNVWYGSSDGLYELKETNGAFALTHYDKAQGFMHDAITCIREDAQGGMWIGTYGDGVYRYDGKRFSRIDSHLELYKQTVLDIFFDNRGNAWLATLNNGIAQYSTANKTFNWLTENEGLSNNHVQSIIQDKSGNYWFGTSGGGVCNYFGKQFTTYDKSSGLGGNFIYSIFRDSRNCLWVGTSDKGVSIFDSSEVRNFNAGNGFANVKVKAMAEDREGVIYLGTDGDGVYSFDGKDFKPVPGLTKKYIRAIVKDKIGDLYFATAGTGLYKLSSANSKNKLQNITTTNGLLHDRLTCLYYDKQNRLWYGTENNGIGYLINDIPQKRAITKKDGLPSNTIRCLAEDESGYLWVGTGGYGIAALPLYDGDFKAKAYDHTHGLTSSNIYLLTVDRRNNLFIGTETGLDYITLDKARKPLEVKHYSKGEGFTGIETCQNSVFNDADGTIWFGTINGLSRYNPTNAIKNEHEPVTSITDVKLFYEPIANTPYKNFVHDWNNVSYLDLPYDQNHLTFDFFAINFSNPDAVKYQWKLEGFDKEWSPVSKNHSILYSNLGAGDYTFMVKACNEDGVWNATPVTLKFHIGAPLWQRWWFIALMILFITAIVFFIFRWRENRIRAKSEELQRKLQLEKDVVELEQKALRLQMNPHFIFNALNSIQSQIGTDNEQAARYYLAKFSRLMRQILDNSRSTSIPLEEEVNMLENYLLIEKFCNGDRFEYMISVDPEVEKDYIKIPPMLLQPFVENAIKHGLKHIDNRRGLISVHFAEKEGFLECTVTDNGIGRKRSEELNKTSKETYHQSTALIVTQERLELLNGDQRSLEIIDLYDEEGNAKGTKVVLRIRI